MYKLSPSDLTFLWSGCKYCFYLKVKHKIAYRGAFPSIFGKMSNLTSNFYHEQPSEIISPDLPPGRLILKEKFVRSVPISFPGLDTQAYISGRFDAVIEFNDGSYGVVDYKTSDAKEEHANFYKVQLSAYAYALENPAPKALGLNPVSRLGLFVVTPDSYERTSGGEMVFVNRTTWVEIPRDDENFLTLIREMLSVLGRDDPPKPSINCPQCSYRSQVLAFDK